MEDVVQLKDEILGMDLEEFAEEDVERVKKEKGFVRVFLDHKAGDLDEARNMMVEALKWRKAIGINKFSMTYFLTPDFEPVLKWGAMKYCGFDSDGNDMLWLRCEKIQKNHPQKEMIQHFFSYVLYLHHEKFRGGEITIVFDLSSTGLSNVDMDILKFQVACFLRYFPCICFKMLIIEMPWVLSAVWTVIKGWLPKSSQKKIVFVKKAQIPSHVPVKYIPTHLNGESTELEDFTTQQMLSEGPWYTGYGSENQFLNPPKSKATPQSNGSIPSPDSGMASSQLHETMDGINGDDDDDDHFRDSMSINTMTSRVNLESKQEDGSRTPTRLSDGYATIKRSRAEKTTGFTYIYVSSREVAFTSRPGQSEEAIANIQLANISNRPIAFKVKASARAGKYFARPVFGVLHPSPDGQPASYGSTTANIQFTTSQKNLATCSKDSFMLETVPMAQADFVAMSTSVPDRNVFLTSTEPVQKLIFKCTTTGTHSSTNKRSQKAVPDTSKSGSDETTTQMLTDVSVEVAKLQMQLTRATGKINEMSDTLNSVKSKLFWITALLIIVIAVLAGFIAAGSSPGIAIETKKAILGGGKNN